MRRNVCYPSSLVTVYKFDILIGNALDGAAIFTSDKMFGKWKVQHLLKEIWEKLKPNRARTFLTIDSSANNSKLDSPSWVRHLAWSSARLFNKSTTGSKRSALLFSNSLYLRELLYIIRFLMANNVLIGTFLLMTIPTVAVRVLDFDQGLLLYPLFCAYVYIYIAAQMQMKVVQSWDKTIENPSKPNKSVKERNLP